MRDYELFRTAADEAAAGALIQEVEPVANAEAKRLPDNREGLAGGAGLRIELHHETTPREPGG